MKLSNVLSNIFSIDIDHVSIAIYIVIVLSPSPSVVRRQCVHLSIETKLIEQIYQVSVQKTRGAAYYVLHALYIHSIKHPSL